MNDTAPKAKKATSKAAAVAVSVEILTRDHEIQGLVYVARDADENRRISDLLNDADKRFLAVTDAKMVSRQNPGSPRQVAFLQIHMDHILMLYPSGQAASRKLGYGVLEAERLDKMRSKLAKK
ncbi:MAG: hypothetical protein VKJ04_05985 [Vampirovibrionales bacterium]|nr:hypothetical protein [Vampirovibrionales bacterium]